MSQTRSSARPGCNPLPPRVERLEERTLLSAGRSGTGFLDFSALRADRDFYASTSILVRFRPDMPALPGSSFLSGTTLGPALGLVPGLHSVRLHGVTVATALAAYRANPWVMYAEPNYTLRTAATFPNDPQFDQQWALYNIGQTGGQENAHINAPLVWDCCVGAPRQTVAVIDTGIDYNHPDLYRNVWINPREIPASRRANLLDLDGDSLITFWDLNDPANQGPFRITDLNGDGRISAADLLMPMVRDGQGNDLGGGGWVNGVSEYGGDQADDLVGWNFAAGNHTPLDTDGHGTHVAGIIGAIGDNGLGVSGVNWRVQLMALKIGDGESLNLEAAVSALAYAVANGASVSNHSYISFDAPQALYDAIASARDFGHIVVAAAGNDGSDNDLTPVYPAGFNLENVIAVAATDHADGRGGFSNYGLTTVHLGAPGVDILSTSPGGGYTSRSGTSMAAAYVTGAAALLRELFPLASFREIIDLILSSADPIESLAGHVITGARLSLSRICGGISTDPDINDFAPGGPVGDPHLGLFALNSAAGDDAVAISLLLNGRSEQPVENAPIEAEMEQAEPELATNLDPVSLTLSMEVHVGGAIAQAKPAWDDRFSWAV